MRCADFGPTPGRQRKAAISSSSEDGGFIKLLFKNKCLY
jgi:hypothetical protein